MSQSGHIGSGKARAERMENDRLDTLWASFLSTGDTEAYIRYRQGMKGREEIAHKDKGPRDSGHKDKRG